MNRTNLSICEHENRRVCSVHVKCKVKANNRSNLFLAGSTVKRVGQWLANMVDRCNDKMGAPYRKCMKAFEDGVNDCR